MGNICGEITAHFLCQMYLRFIDDDYNSARKLILGAYAADERPEETSLGGKCACNAGSAL